VVVGLPVVVVLVVLVVVVVVVDREQTYSHDCIVKYGPKYEPVGSVADCMQ
jgi:hypothetical protein